MSTLCTMPGRHGDILWSLLTARALAEQFGEPVDLAIAGKYGSISPLLQEQPYIRLVFTLDTWQIQETAPITPREAPLPPAMHWDRIYHLGYESWPTPDLPRDVARRTGVEIDLERPWISAVPIKESIVVGFSDEWFEMKVGLVELLTRGRHHGLITAAKGSRWDREYGAFIYSWVDMAEKIAGADLFLGCCSALHVLAVGLGKPCVIYEPNKDRHNSVFWPLGMDGQVRIVRGGDGLPTIDARHTADTIAQMLKEYAQ